MEHGYCSFYSLLHAEGIPIPMCEVCGGECHITSHMTSECKRVARITCFDPECGFESDPVEWDETQDFVRFIEDVVLSYGNYFHIDYGA